MLKPSQARAALIAVVVSIAFSAGAFADGAKQAINIPAGDLGQALATLAKQAGVGVVYRPEHVQGIKTSGVNGELSVEDAVAKLLENTSLVYTTDSSGAVLVSEPMRRATSTGVDAAGAYGAVEGGLRVAQAGTGAAKSATGQDEAGQTATGSEDSSQDTRLDEIVVTAQKRVERLQDVPVAVSAVSGATLVNSNLLRLEDYYQKLPGVSLALAGNGSEPMIVIRGMSTTLGGNPTAGVVIDEVPYGRSLSLSFPVSMADIDPGDLSQVEVLRGPQGTLYGASSIGGLIKFVTVDPSTAGFSGRLQVGSSRVHRGDDFGYSVRGAVNVPVGDTLALRLSGFSLRDPGYIDNAQTGEDDINTRDSDGGRLSALWRPSENFSLKLSALFQDSLRTGMADSDLTLEPELARMELPGVGDYRRKSNSYSATMTGTLGAVQLVSATGYSVDERDNSAESLTLRTAANTNFPGSGNASIAQWLQNSKFSQELRASLPIGQRLDWLFGLFYTEEKDQYRVNVLAHTSNGDVAGLLLRNLGLPDTSFEERAAFTNLTVNFTDRFDVQFGGRISENEQVFARASVTPFGAYPVDAAPNFFQTSRSEDDAFTYLVTPRFRISPDLMTYVRVASGYRPGGPNFNCGILPASLCVFDADTSTNYEIGVKGTLWDRKLSFDTSVYYIDWKDLQVGPLTFVPGTTYLTNASRATSEGVELSLETRPLTGLKLSGWVAYNEAELADPLPTGTGTTFINAGTRLPFSSRWTGTLSAEQEFPLTLLGEAKWYVGADASYVGERPDTLSNTNMVTAKPSYVKVDLRGGARYDTWSVDVFVNNLTDRRGILRGAGVLGPNMINYIQPRTIGLSLTKDFGR